PRSGLLAAWALDPVTGRRLAGPARSRTPGEVVTLAVPAGAVVGWRLLPADAAGTPPGPDAAVPVEVTLVPAGCRGGVAPASGRRSRDPAGTRRRRTGGGHPGTRGIAAGGARS